MVGMSLDPLSAVRMCKIMPTEIYTACTAVLPPYLHKTSFCPPSNHFLDESLGTSCSFNRHFQLLLPYTCLFFRCILHTARPEYFKQATPTWVHTWFPKTVSKNFVYVGLHVCLHACMYVGRVVYAVVFF